MSTERWDLAGRASGQHHEQNAQQIGPFMPFRLSDSHLMIGGQIASSEDTT